jgi:hypothetical protein
VMAFARESLNLGHMLHSALSAVAGRVGLHHAPPLGARAGSSA